MSAGLTVDGPLDKLSRLEHQLGAELARRRMLGFPLPAELDEAHRAARQSLAIRQLAGVAADGNVARQIDEVDEIVSADEVGLRARKPVRTVRHHAQSGRLPGAKKIAGAWMIPLRAALAFFADPERNTP